MTGGEEIFFSTDALTDLQQTYLYQIFTEYELDFEVQFFI